MRDGPKENGIKEKIVYKINLPRLGNLRKWSLLKRGKKKEKRRRDRTRLTNDFPMLHSPGTNMDFYVSRDLFLFMPLCIYKFFKHCFIKI